MLMGTVVHSATSMARDRDRLAAIATKTDTSAESPHLRIAISRWTVVPVLCEPPTNPDEDGLIDYRGKRSVREWNPLVSWESDSRMFADLFGFPGVPDPDV